MFQAKLRSVLFLLTIVLTSGTFRREEPTDEAIKNQENSKWTAVLVQDYEKATSLPKVWVVNLPNEKASVERSTDHPQEGQHCLKLRYQFTAGGQVQYLGIPNKMRIQARVHQVHFQIHGDNSKCSYAIQVMDAHGETHQFGKAAGQGGEVDFTGWKQVSFNLDAGHETWGGDKNGKLDYPITGITLIVGQPMNKDRGQAALGSLYFDRLTVESERSPEETLGCQVDVVSPEYCSDIQGDTKITLAAPGFKTLLARCWQAGEGFGQDAIVARVTLDGQGQGSFVFPAQNFPHGPITLRISGDNGWIKDTCYLQLYNKSGKSWKEGIPAEAPQAARGMKLLFADDFKGPLSISSTDPKATYYEHKPPHGWQDFSQHVFSNHDSPKNPFAQIDTYLRIRASDRTMSSGLISSMKNDASGIKVTSPCYFECRMLGPNAVGAWPGFWLMTDYMSDYGKLKDKTPCDELDIIEAYGGEGPGSPNAHDRYMITPHCWNQGDAGKALETRAVQALNNPIRMKKAGIPSTWFETFHVYGCKVTPTETIYTCDDIEVGRHSTLPLSRTQPLFFMINLATGGGWPVDLSRYHGQADLHVDYVRVYQGTPTP